MGIREQSNQLTAVLIDDNPDHLVLMNAALEQAFLSDGLPVSVRSFEHPANGLAELTDDHRQVILLDYQFSGSTGIDWISDFVRLDTGPVIIVTSSGDEHIAAQAFRAGAADYIVKSEVLSKPALLRRSIMESLRKHGLERTNRDLAMKLKQVNRELQIKNDKLSEITNTAHRFVEDVAHEFRTPLTVIKEFAAIIDDGIGGPVTQKQSEYLKHIIGSTGDLAELINDFLNCSRLRSNNICVHRQEHRVDSLINTVRPILQSRATAKSVVLEFEIDPDLPPIYADADKAQRSLINLVINAIKYSGNTGKIRISATRMGDDRVRIAVSDEGAGLPPESVEQLFARFRQGGTDNGHLANGFGLGLCIVNELVSINYGQVEVESELGVGSTFSFTLPCSNTSSILRGLIRQAEKSTSKHYIAVFAAQRTLLDQPNDELISDLSRACMPLDIAIPGPDSSTAYLIGLTTNYASFRERILSSVHEQNKKSGVSTSPLQLNFVGHWPCTQAYERIIDLIQSPIESESKHDKVGAHH